MREIEVKARVRDLEGLNARLNERGVLLSAPSVQVDTIYVPMPLRLKDVDASVTPILRIRISGASTRLTLKRDIKGSPDCIEHEVKVDDSQEMATILAHLGYHVAVEVRKRRRTGCIENVTLCVDEVEGLGAFVELEALLNEMADASSVRSKLDGLLHSLGIGIQEKVAERYDRMVDAEIDRRLAAERTDD